MNKITLVGNYNAQDQMITCKRLSNNYDVIPVQFPDIVKVPQESGEYKMEGSITNDKGQVYVEVYSYDKTEGVQNSTACELVGEIKKLYPVRTTKKDNKLQDLLVEAGGQMVKVVAFEPCPDFIKVGQVVRVRGRLQSRAFTQLTTFGTLSKIVYEVALKNLEVLEDKEKEEDLSFLDDIEELMEDPFTSEEGEEDGEQN